MYNTIQANTLSELQADTLGLHHDHCTIYYFGSSLNTPIAYSHLDITDKYVAIYKED